MPMSAKGVEVRPIQPHQITGQRERDAFNAVIEVVNELLQRKMRGNLAVILQREIVDALIARGYSEADIRTNRLLDFESVYEANGWEVVYNKPGFNENNYEPRFEFKAKKK